MKHLRQLQPLTDYCSAPPFISWHRPFAHPHRSILSDAFSHKFQFNYYYQRSGRNEIPTRFNTRRCGAARHGGMSTTFHTFLTIFYQYFICTLIIFTRFFRSRHCSLWIFKWKKKTVKEGHNYLWENWMPPFISMPFNRVDSLHLE